MEPYSRYVAPQENDKARRELIQLKGTLGCQLIRSAKKKTKGLVIYLLQRIEKHSVKRCVSSSVLSGAASLCLLRYRAYRGRAYL